jgi:serine protease AprX
MRRALPGGHRARAFLAAAALTVVSVGAGTPAEADLLDPVEDVVDGIIGEPVPTGWLYDASATSMSEVRAAIGAEVMWARGYTGEGVGVALIDTGVVPVSGLTSGNVRNAADLSFDGLFGQGRWLDGFGHGTHLAGIIAGEDPAGPDPERFLGVAPDARLYNVKVGASDGGVDVSQVVAAIDWVVEHRDDDPANPIRVLNLSYGTDGVQDFEVDPLTHAVQNAWRAGIVVVVSGGNAGFGSPRLNNPAYDPHVIAVGAADLAGTAPLSGDDVVPDFSSRGDASRRVDLVAPGRSIVSLRDPGSYIDSAHPGARVGERFFKGSGTSQAAAVVSGAVALLLEQRPELTPDQVKALLRSTAAPMPVADTAGRGAGELDVAAAGFAVAPTAEQAQQSWPTSRGTGSLNAARGTQSVADGGVELSIEWDVMGPWHASRWAADSTAGTSWVGGRWNGDDWTGSCWCSSSWAGPSWQPRPWGRASWAGRQWNGRQWNGRQWNGRQWNGDGWLGRQWNGRQWNGGNWS